MALWIEQGLTSRYHPLLQHALKTYLEPIGMRCEVMEMEPFSILETGVGGLQFTRPAFDPKLITRSEARALFNRNPSLKAEVAVSGHAFFTSAPGTNKPESVNEDMERLAYLFVGAVDEAREFLLAAAMALVDEATPDSVKQAYLDNNTRALCAHAQGLLTPEQS